MMPALVNELEWPGTAAAGRPTGPRRLGRTARIMAHLFGWPLLAKAGLLTGFALAAAVQHHLAV